MQVHQESTDRVIQVSVGEIEDFDQDDFHRFHDQFQHALILPQNCLDALDMAPYNYAEVTPSGQNWKNAEVVYVLPFGDDFSLEPAKPEGLLKGSYQERIFDQRMAGDRDINVRKHETAQQQGSEVNLYTPTRLPVENDTGLSTCYLNKGKLEESQFEDGDRVEVYNPMNGNRASLTVEGNGRLQRDSIAIGNVNRDSLRVISVDERSKPGWGEQLGIRPPVESQPPNRSLPERVVHQVWKRFVGYNRINLEVKPGLDIDEERRIARVEPDTRNLLGIDSGDRVVIEWGGKEHSVKCLDLPDDVDVSARSATGDEASDATEDDAEEILTGTHSSNHIYMPSTERKAVDACIEDLVKVRRDMKYTMGKQIAVSILGILAALITGDWLFSSLSSYVASALVPGQSTTIQTAAQVGTGIVTFVLLSVTIVWVLMYPKRQETEI